MIREIDSFKWANIKKSELNIIQDLFSDFKEEQVFITSSGKASLDIILSYFRKSGHLHDKNSEVWVPKWIGSWVYNIMQKRCFPTIIPSESTRGVVVYHQYGYPQNIDIIMSKARAYNWFVIEDCAHAIMSYYKSKRVGSFGDAGIFSFSKFFPSLMGGAIVTKNKQLGQYIQNRLNNVRNWGSTLSFLSKLFLEKSNNKKLRSFWGKWVEMSYGVYDLNININRISEKIIKQRLMEKALIKRNENKDFFLDRLSDLNVFDEIGDHKAVIPYFMPLIAEGYRLHNIKNQLLEHGVYTGIYPFDVNRNMGDTNFKKCVGLPVHEGINHSNRQIIVDAIRIGFNEKS